MMISGLLFAVYRVIYQGSISQLIHRVHPGYPDGPHLSGLRYDSKGVGTARTTLDNLPPMRPSRMLL